MFTGIIESLGTVIAIEKDRSNVNFTIESPISADLKIDQSISHDGVCLTVTKVEGSRHWVTAIAETLSRTKLSAWSVGSLVNLERCMALGARLDGHIVQGHVDGTGTCLSVTEANGSWVFTFQYQVRPDHLLVDKGSVCVNGVSLTVVNPIDNQFSVAIIPYTWEHTNFHLIESGQLVNLEFDIIGKYLARHLAVWNGVGMKVQS